MCNGEATVEDTAASLGVTAEAVEDVLAELFRNGLTLYPECTSEQAEALSRRKFVAGATAAAGLVLSLGLPTAAAAASCVTSSGCNFGNSGTPCDEGGGACTNNCMNCYSYSGLDISNKPIPNGQPCRFVINIAACSSYGSGGSDFQQSCAASYPLRGTDQGWCCVPVGNPFIETAANGGGTPPTANGGGSCSF